MAFQLYIIWADIEMDLSLTIVAGYGFYMSEIEQRFDGPGILAGGWDKKL